MQKLTRLSFTVKVFQVRADNNNSLFFYFNVLLLKSLKIVVKKNLIPRFNAFNIRKVTKQGFAFFIAW